eukprot:TRINITY_DN68125_c3_g1_i1.p1 TRINITY_DN68125_c3_g1~~TRINITY_DN68125_c3_g1_i1.p1  ORF type:complete len:379 (-),score=92.05 TRINITY_DN68125_c3_g1_i1:157-1269(-)
MPEVKYDNGDKYEGDTAGGKREGKGVYTTNDGAQFAGNWKADNLEGHGTYTGNDGKYAGDWEESMKSGKGEFTWPEGDNYTGDWYQDNMNGEGVFKWANGKVYTGFFRDGQRNGLGSLTFPDGRKYEGEFKNDECCGFGRFHDANGVYEGEWSGNLKHGKGKYTYKDGRVFDGDWINDKKTTGIVYEPDGAKFKVTFAPDGSVVSQEDITDPPPVTVTKAEAPPKDQTIPSWLGSEKATDDQKKKRNNYIASWLDQSPDQRAEHKPSALALSFGGEPSKYVRGGTAGTIYFRDHLKDQDSKTTYTKQGQVIPFEELKLPSKWNRPDIDPSKRETYLSDDEFQNLFKMPRADFANLGAWRRNQMKKQFKLF